MNVEVTSVARKGQKLSDTPAAVFVITQEDIRRSGATTLPDVLRIVPGLQVARVNGNVRAVSARGFNSRFADKILVTIDGRTVYRRSFPAASAARLLTRPAIFSTLVAHGSPFVMIS